MILANSNFRPNTFKTGKLTSEFEIVKTHNYRLQFIKSSNRSIKSAAIIAPNIDAMMEEKYPRGLKVKKHIYGRIVAVDVFDIGSQGIQEGLDIK